jgi:hypothetical protein
MQFCDEKAQNLKNVNTDRCGCPYDKCQYHQPRRLCLKNELRDIGKCVNCEI